MRGNGGRFPILLLGVLVLMGPLGSTVASESKSVDRMSSALGILLHVPSGRALLERAQKFWKIPRPEDLKSVLRWGIASKTDAVLTRHFDPATGEERRERQVTVYLRESQGLEDTVLDLAHELVHATSRPSWDPYDPQLTAGKYIWAAIEGEGGEVDAVEAECRVGFELLERYGAASLTSRRCRGYLESRTTELSRELIRKDFYRVGKWSSEIREHLGRERSLFPMLSPDVPRLYSSTGHAPYPVALFREFQEITQIACENSRKRAEASRNGLARTPAAAAGNGISHFITHRCSN